MLRSTLTTSKQDAKQDSEPRVPSICLLAINKTREAPHLLRAVSPKYFLSCQHYVRLLRSFFLQTSVQARLVGCVKGQLLPPVPTKLHRSIKEQLLRRSEHTRHTTSSLYCRHNTSSLFVKGQQQRG